jgi:hypothetical protein
MLQLCEMLPQVKRENRNFALCNNGMPFSKGFLSSESELTPWGRVLLQKLIVQKFPAF